MNISELVARNARKYAEREAIIEGTERITYRICDQVVSMGRFHCLNFNWVVCSVFLRIYPDRFFNVSCFLSCIDERSCSWYICLHTFIKHD